MLQIFQFQCQFSLEENCSKKSPYLSDLQRGGASTAQLVRRKSGSSWQKRETHVAAVVFTSWNLSSAATLRISAQSKDSALQFRLYIPFLGIARPQSQFPHSCVCERIIYSYIFPPAEQADPLLEYIIRSQTHECGNWDWGPSFSGNIFFKFSAFCLCSVLEYKVVYDPVFEEKKTMCGSMTD